MNQIDIIITCMGRLDHLKQSLPLALNQKDTGCIVVDYSCPEGCGDWVEKQMPGARVVRVPGKRFFNISVARNAGARASQAPWLFFLDADMLLDRLFIEERVLPELSDNRFLTFSIPDQRDDISGQCICPRKAFEDIGGYDEAFQGWGREDKDLYQRLRLAGLDRRYLPGKSLPSIQHGDDMRMRNFGHGNKRLNQAVNYLYSRAKLDAQKLKGVELPVGVRQEIYRKAHRNVVQALKSGNGRDLSLQIEKGGFIGLEISSNLHYHIDPFPGRWSPGAITEHRLPDFRDALELINSRWPGVAGQSTEEPLFLLAAGHRSGSTLLQRMMMERRWMWGEPYGRAGLIDNLSLTFRAFTGDWPQERYFSGKHPGQTDNDRQAWTANLYPELSALVAATRHYLLTLFRTPATAKGYRDWGLKEVTLDADMASFLKWLFPASRFVFLIRNPYEAYLSYLRRNEVWYARWPGEPLNSPEAFGAQWARLTQGFLEHSGRLDALVIRYEELTGGHFDWSALEAHVGHPVDTDVLGTKIGGSYGDTHIQRNIEEELARLTRAVEPLASSIGYCRPVTEDTASG